MLLYLLVIAEADRIDPRPLAEIKAAAEEEKSRIKAQADELTAKVDEVIALLPAKVDEVAPTK